MVDVKGIPRIAKKVRIKFMDVKMVLMDVKMVLSDLEISHRTSQCEDAPILVKFASRRIRNKFWENRNKHGTKL